jgi:hypothetical protein
VFFLVRPWAFLGITRGAQKHHKLPQKTFLLQLHVENFSQTNRQKLRCQFFLDILFYCVSGVSQRWEFKITTKKKLQKILSKSFNKKIDKNPKPIFSRFVYQVFGRFSVRGVQKHHQKISEKNLTLVLFWPLTHPPITGVTDFLFIGGPLFSCFGSSTKHYKGHLRKSC